MSILVGDNFSYSAAKPLDGRLKYDTLASMKAVADATMYEGCLAYCVETDKTYQWKSTNTVDADTGRWREYESGGGGHEILDAEDTALTQREKLKFGNGLTASDNSTDEQTEVEVDVMSSEDMDDVVTPLPSVGARYHKYSTEEQVVGEWIDGKPIYEKTIVFPKSSLASNEHTYTHGIADVDIIWFDLANSFIKETQTNSMWSLASANNINNTASGYKVFTVWISSSGMSINIGTAVMDRITNHGGTMYVTLRYTKTTD